jgi:hypothetical protein
MDPHSFEKLDPDPHSPKKLDPDRIKSMQSETLPSIQLMSLFIS